MWQEIALYIKTHYLAQIVSVAVCYAAVLTAVFIDLVTGLRKSHALQVPTSSLRLRSTAGKTLKYIAPMTCLTLIDLMAAAVLPLPLFTLLWAAYCIWCEYVSVREKAWRKQELETARKTISVMIGNEKELAEKLVTLLFDHKDKRQIKTEITDGKQS